MGYSAPIFRFNKKRSAFNHYMSMITSAAAVNDLVFEKRGIPEQVHDSTKSSFVVLAINEIKGARHKYGNFLNEIIKQ